MTVGELRVILDADWIPDDLIIMDYEDQMIDNVNLVIDKNGGCNEIRFAMTKV